MKQILQSLKNGRTHIFDVPIPQLKPNHVLIQTHCSLISPGTEKMLIAFGQSSWLAKAKQQPEKVREVINKIKTDGVLPTMQAITHKLDELIPMGYSNVGTVIARGAAITELCIGDRVVSNGAHAEIVSVAKNLCCKIPSQVSNDEAAFTILGAIALQGIRSAEPQLGEVFAVIGLGLIGLLTIQLLRANGCRVIGIDIDPAKLTLAKQFGIDAASLACDQNQTTAAAAPWTNGQGVDGVLITCATESHSPISQAAQLCRKRGRIILVGVSGLQLSRRDFYEKEIRFQVSCAYGPGRYDPQYECAGLDYPHAYVRFTAQRNFAAFLDLLARQTIDVKPLITERYEIEQADRAYQALTRSQSQPTNVIGIMLDYKTNSQLCNVVQNKKNLGTTLHRDEGVSPILGFIGAGLYARRTLIPAFKKTKIPCSLAAIASENGIHATQVGQRFRIPIITSDARSIIHNAAINTVIIATRHDTHADFIIEALNARKHVFVEKPLCITHQQLTAIEQAIKHSNTQLMVGFNRRFSPFIQKITSLLAMQTQAKTCIMTINAGLVAKDHWIQDKTIGGGRIIGEVCHFIDLLRFVIGSPIRTYQVQFMSAHTAHIGDHVTITLSFDDGSLGTIHYFANGHSSFAKERLEIFSAGCILQLNNFRHLAGFGFKEFKSMRGWRQNKGHELCVHAFLQAIANGLPAPIPIQEILETTRITLDIAKDLAERNL